MLKNIIIGFLVILAILMVVISMQPNEFKVNRQIEMNASAADVFAEVSDLHKWDAWSPWAKLDPNSKTTFEGPDQGTGAKMSWAGNWELGVGSMTIIDSRPNNNIKFRLDFEKPLKSTSNAEFTFKEEAGKTLVTWSMFEENNFIGKAIGLIFNCEKMIGEQFEKGLVDLKKIAEAK